MNNDPLPKISTKNLNLSFAEKHVLKDINISFPAKKITALIGPSGCGKSTLLRSFNRMHDLLTYVHISGEIFLDGNNIYEDHLSVTQVRKKIGMVFQKANPFPKTIYENIAYGLRINNFEKHKIGGMVEQALNESYLWEEVKDELKKPATQLSGGQQQRLCIARAVALRPEVILMDEPCSALDPISTKKIEELILELKKDYTIIIVTHSMQQAQRIADETAFMYLGELIEAGKTKDIFTHAQKELTRNYIEGHFG
jgi:phosphate transport system ATP-binding protein